MKTNLKTKLLSGALLLNMALSAQMTFFTTPNYKFNMTGSTPVGSSLISGGVQGTYNMANGCYDDLGNLLFYVTDGGIYKSNGTSAGNLGAAGYSNVWNPVLSAYSYEYYSQLGCTEFEIVPVPGSCKIYYVIYSLQLAGSGNKTCYIKVDCSSGTPVVIYNGTTTAPGHPAANNVFAIGTSLDGGNVGLAASQIISGSGSSAIRYLYTVSSNGVVYYSISNTGITGGTAMPYTVSGVSYYCSELELSPDGNWLAWNGGSAASNQAYIGQLTGTKTSFQTGLQWAASTTGAVYKGLEFTAAAGIPLLYLAGSNGLSYVSTATQSQPFLISSGSYDMSNTFLELGKNGQIYGISKTATTEHLVGINSSNVLTGTAVTFDSRYMISNGLWANGIYTLPNQIDGQNYNDFGAFQNVSLNGLTINGQNIIGVGNCDQLGFVEVCGLSPIYMNVSYLNNYTTNSSYKIDIIAVDSDCDPIYTYQPTTFMYYQGSWTTGTVPANVDLRGFTDPYGHTILSQENMCYIIQVSVRDACGNVNVKNGYLVTHITGSPALKVYSYTTGTYLNASQNIASPVLVGALSTAIRLNTSTGPSVSYQFVIDQVNSAGAFIKNIYTKTATSYNMSTVSDIVLNTLCVSGSAWAPTVPGGGNCPLSTSTDYTGYFGYMSGQLCVGNYYKVTLYQTPGNMCSAASTYCYIYFNTGYSKPANVTGIENNSAEQLINTEVYPNPANDQVNFTIDTPASDKFTIAIYDIVGKTVAVLAENKTLNMGVNNLSFNIQNLASGIYTYKINTSGYVKSGRLSITK